MQLNLAKLQHVREGADRTRAQCPACAENGHDTKGEHLSIERDGRFGCAVHPGDHKHRQRIWALAGDGGRLPARAINVRPVVLRRAWQFPDYWMPAKKFQKTDSRTSRTLQTNP